MRITAWLFGVLLSILGSVAGAETLSYTTYYHNDHLGSPVAATNEQGALLWRAHFRPYGERQENPKDAAYGSVGYTGHIQDADSGMVYAGARYYDPLIGRFMAIDPVGAVASMPGSFNRYAYVQNNPYRFIDPNGEWLEDAVIGVPSLALGASSLSENVQNGQWGGAALDAGGMVWLWLCLAYREEPDYLFRHRGSCCLKGRNKYQRMQTRPQILCARLCEKQKRQMGFQKVLNLIAR